ncbi:MAG: glycine--tRNA ligase subunit beta [Gammaproteobacteria bacterium]|nr:glycine--tRNA ligase subunit beta [Gammaproteobacteria bacterium]
MIKAADFLVEIGTEELPPKALKALASRFRTELESRITSAGLQYSHAREYATPRRLAVVVGDLALAQATQSVERRGPAVSAAFDATGSPTPATLGFARSCGVAFENLERLTTDKGDWLVYRAQQPGQLTAALVPAFVNSALAALPIPKRMRWGDHEEAFVRPVHWVILLHGETVIPATILGIASDRITRGHRFMGQAEIVLGSPADYLSALKKNNVRADFAERRGAIAEMVEVAAAKVGGHAILDDDLLDEVTALVEWPVPIVGSFDQHFLEVPREALIATMQSNQKYFPLEDGGGKLLNLFITISNIESPQPELIREGNQRVIRPRLSDAAFFFDRDRKSSLEARHPQLGAIVFERRLGSLLEKTERVAQLAGKLAPVFSTEVQFSARAAALSRCDLVTEMVGEFPELQGTMGGYYARHDGEPEAVAAALAEFYLPRFAGDKLPATAVGRCIAVADRIDTLLGIFAIGAVPSGDKDPFALRRAALGCLRICIEGAVPLDLKLTLGLAAEGYAREISRALIDQVLDFILERSRAYFIDDGKRPDILEAVLTTRPTAPHELAERIAALEAFLKLPMAASLAAANKRIANILKKAEPTNREVVATQALEPAEDLLTKKVAMVEADAESAFVQGNFTEYLNELTKLHDVINSFFEHVMVMVEDPAVRARRTALLRRIHEMFLRVADLGVIAH